MVCSIPAAVAGNFVLIARLSCKELATIAVIILMPCVSFMIAIIPSNNNNNNNSEWVYVWLNCVDVSADEERRQHAVVQAEGSYGGTANIQG